MSGAEGSVEGPDTIGAVIIGAGLSGIGMGIKLVQSGQSDFVILEKADGPGGTWRKNTYPGVECDIHAQLYSYSFAPKLDWKKNYGTQPELLSYLEACIETFDLAPRIRYGTGVTSARWNPERSVWELETSGGPIVARALVSATGYLSEPKIPDLPGLADFSGPSFHTSDWDHSVDLAGKRVAIIGVGASAVQVVPEIQPGVAQLDIYQRSPAWFMPKHDHAVTGFKAWAQRSMPGYSAFLRLYHYWTAELVPFQLSTPARAYFMQRIVRSYLRKNVSSPELRSKLEPEFTVGCKRILFSDTYYDAVAKPNVDLVTDGIAAIEPDGLVTEDGRKRPADVLVLATGLGAALHAIAPNIVGTAGTLEQCWKDGRFAYLGASVPGFPNFFMMLGPNTGVGHTSITVMIEAQIRYIVDALKTLGQEGLASVEVKEDVAKRFDADIQRRLAPSVWNAGGCTSYYRDGDGKNVAIWPGTTIRFRKLTRRFDLENYDVRESGYSK